MGIPAFIFPESLAHCWWKPLEAVGLHVTIVDVPHDPGSLQTPALSAAVVKHNKAAVYVGTQRAKGRLIQIAGPQGIVATARRVGLARGDSELICEVSRILVASGAKSCGGGCGFKVMLTGLEVPIFALSHELAKLGTRVQKKSGDATRWVVKRQRARVDVIAGYGLDIDSKTSVPFVAIEYHLSFRMQARIRRHPALKGTSATEVLAQDVSRVLMGQGLLQLDAVVAWPDILNGHSKRDGSELY